MKHIQQGFTLIELMIVVAIIGILAAVAVPQYQNYTIRSQVTEGLAMASEFKTAVSEYRANRGAFPVNNGQVGFGAATTFTGNYVSGIQITNGDVTMTYGGTRVNAALKSKTLRLRVGTNAAGSVVWACGNAANPQGSPTMVSAVGAGTNVPGAFLPTDCRS